MSHPYECSFQCPDSGADMRALYQFGRLVVTFNEDHERERCRAVESSDANTQLHLDDTRAWLRPLHQHRFASVEDAREALIDAGVDYGDTF